MKAPIGEYNYNKLACKPRFVGFDERRVFIGDFIVTVVIALAPSAIHHCSSKTVSRRDVFARCSLVHVHPLEFQSIKNWKVNKERKRPVSYPESTSTR